MNEIMSLIRGVDRRVIRFKRANPGETMSWDEKGFKALKILAQTNGLPIGDSFMYMGVRHEADDKQK